MPRILFQPLNMAIEVAEGTTILDAALDNNVPIESDCGGNCVCCSCHVIIEEGFETLNEKTEEEQDMLDEAEDVTDNSRLACQCDISANLVVRIPAS